MNTKHALFLSLVMVLTSHTCFADESVARIPAGGIKYQHTSDIQVKAEEFDISADMISVMYQFYNQSDRNITSTFAFPMPAYSFHPGFSESADRIKPIKSFLVSINGQNAEIKSDRQAMVDEFPVTDELRTIGLTDAQIFDKFTACTDEGELAVEHCNTPPVQQSALKKIGKWSVQETAYWQQPFPAHGTQSVIHQYAPAAGHHSFVAYKHKTYAWEPSPNSCENDGSRQAIEKQVRTLVRNGAKTVSVSVQDVEYTFGTSKNWSDTADSFKLRVHKQSPDQVISLCFPGKARKTAPKTLEFTQEHFTPKDKLLINFYTVK